MKTQVAVSGAVSAAAPRFGWRLRLMLVMQEWLTRLRLAPSVADMARQPVAKRKAIRPAPWMTFPLPAGVAISSQVIDSRGGDLALRMFTPAAPVAGRPLMLFIHGGGWCMGGNDALDYLCANVSAQAGVTVASVDYRLAPEHPFPAALEDCYDALCWLERSRAQLAPQSRGLAVMGDSAGGNLTAALCLLAQRQASPRILHQTLIYPSLDATLQSPSMSLVIGGVTRHDLALALAHYAAATPLTEPLISPLLASDLSGLPPAFILTADGDLLRDDGSRYAQALQQAGVPVRLLNLLDAPHAFFSIPKLCPGAPGALAEVVKELVAAAGAHGAASP